MSHTVTVKVNINISLRYGQNGISWPIPAKHLWPMRAKDVPRCKVGIHSFHVGSISDRGRTWLVPAQTPWRKWNIFNKKHAI